MRLWPFFRHDHQPPELHRGVGQGLGSDGDDAGPKGDNPGQRVLALPDDLRMLDRGAAAVPSLVQMIEVESRLSEGPGKGADRAWIWPLVTQLVTRRSTPAAWMQHYQ